jgi:transposase
MSAVMIGIDPHKGSHTAVAISAAEEPLGDLRVRASAAQAGALVAWAAPWPERTWAVEGAGGLGRLLAQQLVAAGERVLDVPPKLAARVRLLQAGDTNKNDPNDALPVAVAALRSKARREVAAEDHAAVLKVWAKRHRDLARARNQVACRLHSVLCDLLAGGVSKEITAAQAACILEQVTPSGPVAAARRELAGQFLEDLRGLDAQLRDTKKKLAAAVSASGTSLTEVFGFGPVNTGTVIGDVTDVTRFPSRDHFASYNGTAPVEVSSGNRKIYRLSLRGNRRINHALHMAAITQIRHAHSGGRTYYDRKIAEGKTHKEALRCLKRRISDAVFARLQADAQKATATAAAKGPGGQPGNHSVSRAAGSHPEPGSSDKPLPGLPPPYGPPPRQVPPRLSPMKPTGAGLRTPRPLRRNPRQPLDTDSKEDSFCADAERSLGAVMAAHNGMICACIGATRRMSGLSTVRHQRPLGGRQPSLQAAGQDAGHSCPRRTCESGPDSDLRAAVVAHLEAIGKWRRTSPPRGSTFELIEGQVESRGISCRRRRRSRLCSRHRRLRRWRCRTCPRRGLGPRSE